MNEEMTVLISLTFRRKKVELFAYCHHSSVCVRVG